MENTTVCPSDGKTSVIFDLGIFCKESCQTREGFLNIFS